MVAASVEFRVNGEFVRAEAGDTGALVHWLRDTLGLKGTRYGCGEEQCGACVVLIDGQPRPSCQLEVGHLAGRHVTTVEALPDCGPGRRLISSFVTHQAGQCGFCLSGMLMRVYPLVASGEALSRERIVGELQPHLCRCGAHPRIVAAVADACSPAISA